MFSYPNNSFYVCKVVEDGDDEYDIAKHGLLILSLKHGNNRMFM